MGQTPFLNRDFLVGLGLGFIMSALILSFIPPVSGVQLTEREGHAIKSSETSKQPGLPVALDSETDLAVQSSGQPAGKDGITVTVSAGATSEDIAALLKEAGLIPNEREFLQLVDKYGAHAKFQVGDYVIPQGASQKEILETLIHKSLD